MRILKALGFIFLCANFSACSNSSAAKTEYNYKQFKQIRSNFVESIKASLYLTEVAHYGELDGALDKALLDYSHVVQTSHSTLVNSYPIDIEEVKLKNERRKKLMDELLDSKLIRQGQVQIPEDNINIFNYSDLLDDVLKDQLFISHLNNELIANQITMSNYKVISKRKELPNGEVEYQLDLAAYNPDIIPIIKVEGEAQKMNRNDWGCIFRTKANSEKKHGVVEMLHPQMRDSIMSISFSLE